MDIKNPAKITINKKENIKIEKDSIGESYTNESIFEFLINRKNEKISNNIGFTSNFDIFEKPTGFGALPKGAFVPPEGNFDIAKACIWISRNSYSRYVSGKCGKCAKFVRLAIEAGGINTNGHPVSAYQYAGFLPKIGFKFVTELSTLESQKSFTEYMAKPGDIAVMAHGKHGHICLYNGNQWVSDFKQNNMWVYSGVGTCQIFRYTKT